MLEFEQMEIEYFVKPEEAAESFRSSGSQAMKAWVELIGSSESTSGCANMRRKSFPITRVGPSTSSTTSRGRWAGKSSTDLANRTDFDLTQHQTVSGEDLTYFDQEGNTRYLPHVIEPTFGVDRTILVLLLDAYDEEATVDVNGKPDTRIVLRLHPRVAPYKAAILPLMKKPELADVAKELFAP